MYITKYTVHVRNYHLQIKGFYFEYIICKISFAILFMYLLQCVKFGNGAVPLATQGAALNYGRGNNWV